MLVWMACITVARHPRRLSPIMGFPGDESSAPLFEEEHTPKKENAAY